MADVRVSERFAVSAEHVWLPPESESSRPFKRADDFPVSANGFDATQV
jgi:hypothetical protein